MSGRLGRIAAAPISWGVCEVPGWGHQMAPARVLREMAELGFAATEAGPDGFLPKDPVEARDTCAAHGLRLVGGFVPATLHRTDRDDTDMITRRVRWLARAGAEVMVLACTTGLDGYDKIPALDAHDRARLAQAVDRACDIARAHELVPAVHPHVGTVVERADQVMHLLEASQAPFCLDTGHLMIGGMDPVHFAKDAGDRISLLQLKDVDAELAARVQRGAVAYTDAVREGIYSPLGSGDVDVAAVLDAVGPGYGGWYVLEQDLVLDCEPPAGTGPRDDVARSRDHLASLLQGS